MSEYSTDRVNWMKGPGSPYARYTIYDNLPAAGDDLHFSGDLSSADCVLPPYGGSPPAPLPPPPPYSPPSPPPPPPPSPPPPVHAGDVFNSIRLEDGYTGSVVLARDLQVNILEVGSGYLAQNYAYDLTASGNTHAGDLTVSGTFAWTGGGIQDGPRAPTYNGVIVEGTLDLAPGAIGLAAPTDAGTVTLGATVTLKGSATTQTGSTLELNDGTYSILRGHFEVEKFSTLITAPTPASAGTGVAIKPNGEEVERLEDGSIVNQGTAIFTSKDRNRSVVPAPITLKGPDKRLINYSSGVVRIESFVKLNLEVTDIPDQDVVTAFRQYAPSDEETPETWLEAGSEIVSAQNAQVRIEEGDLNIIPVFENNQPLARADRVAKITMGVPDGTPALVVGRTVIPPFGGGEPTILVARIAFPQSEPSFVTLKVNGRIDCAGDVSMNLSRSKADKSDFIQSSEMIFGGDTKVWLEWQCASLLEEPVGENTQWVLVDGTVNNGINLVPTLDPPDPGPGGVHVVTLDRIDTNSKLVAKK